MPKNKSLTSGIHVKKKVLKRLGRKTPQFNYNYGNYNSGNGNYSYDGGNFGQPFDPNLPPGGVLYFQPCNVDTTSSSSITIINNTITSGGGSQGLQNAAVWSSPECQVWEQEYNQQHYQDLNNDTSGMPFEWQLPYNNNDNFQWSHQPSDFQGPGSSFWEDESPEAIANPQQFNKQPKKYPKIQKQKGPDNRLKSQDSAIHSSVFANQTEVPPMVPDRLKSSKSAGMSNPVNPFETVETPSEDILFQDMLKPTFNFTNQLAPYNQLVEMPLNVQIDKLVESQKLSPEQLRIRWQLAFDLLYLLRYHYPTCEVYGIDSVLTHFKKADSCLSCDVQLYVDLTGSELTFEDTTSLQSIIQQVKSILGAHRCPHRHGDGFRTFIKMFIKKEKNDKVIQFMHEPSQLTCQLTFQSQLPAKRSQLIRYCIKLDPRISKFIGVLRYWGQYHDLCDDGNDGANKISEYALFLLGLVYLMEEKKMPPVANLPTDLLKPPSHQKDSLDNNSATGENVGGAVMQFMKGFCEKYANLDFKTVVVVPFTGKINSRQAFGLTNQGNVPVSVIMGAGVCIDPFNFKINVFECKDIKVALQSFQVACKKTVKFLEENGGHQDQKSIVDLFITRPQPKNTQMVTLKMTNDFALVYMTKLASADKMLDSFSSVLKTGMMRNKLFNLWKKFAEEFILEIFPTGFKLPTVEEKLDGGNANVNKFKKLYRVSYPFWERLGATELKEEDYQCQDPIQVEKIKSTAILVNYLARKGKLGNDFQESRIQMEYKLNVSAEGIQEMQVRLLKISNDQNLPEQDSEGNNYAVIPAVYRIIQRVFQPYLIYRLNACAIDTN